MGPPPVCAHVAVGVASASSSQTSKLTARDCASPEGACASTVSVCQPGASVGSAPEKLHPPSRASAISVPQSTDTVTAGSPASISVATTARAPAAGTHADAVGAITASCGPSTVVR